jgi:DNA polymerase III subunit beta
MKINCKTFDLLEAINTVQKAVSTKSNMPILEGILLECNETIKFTGYNNEIGIEYLLNGNIESSGSIVVNSRILGEIVRKLPDGDVFIKVEEHKITIDCLMSHFELSGIPADGFPKIPQIEKGNPFEITEMNLRQLIKQTIFAISNDQNKKNFTGSLFHCKENSLTLVSVDGFRLALSKGANFKAMDDFDVIVPGYALNELIKIFHADENKVQLFVTNSLMAFETKKCKIVTRLIQSEFINYKKVVPESSDTKIILKTKDLLASIERASLICFEDKKYPIKFSITENELIITSHAPIGNVREFLLADVIGPNLEIGFNARFLMDSLKNIEDEKIELHFTTPVAPVVIKPLEGDEFLHMILPVKLSDMQSEAENY